MDFFRSCERRPVARSRGQERHTVRAPVTESQSEELAWPGKQGRHADSEARNPALRVVSTRMEKNAHFFKASASMLEVRRQDADIMEAREDFVRLGLHALQGNQ